MRRVGRHELLLPAAQLPKEAPPARQIDLKLSFIKFFLTLFELLNFIKLILIIDNLSFLSHLHNVLEV